MILPDEGHDALHHVRVALAPERPLPGCTHACLSTGAHRALLKPPPRPPSSHLFYSPQAPPQNHEPQAPRGGARIL